MKETWTCSTSAICCRRLAPTRLVPFSYFWTCWKVRPNASPSFSWLMPNMMRRMRTRLPTYLSTGLGALVDIYGTPRGLRLTSVLQAFARNRMRRAPPVCQLAIASRPANLQSSGDGLCDAAPNREHQAGGDDDAGGNIAATRVNGWRDRRRQARVQRAFDAKTEACDNPSQWID